MLRRKALAHGALPVVPLCVALEPPAWHICEVLQGAFPRAWVVPHYSGPAHC